MKSVVTISRYWNNPKIHTVVSSEGISLATELDDFLYALKNEIGSVRGIIRVSTFQRTFDSAVDRVLTKIKEESTKVM